MAWVKSDPRLARHPSVLQAARATGIGIPQMIGHLYLLWWWCDDFTDDGNVTQYLPEEVEGGALWDGPPGELWDALVGAGFIDVYGSEHTDDETEWVTTVLSWENVLTPNAPS